MKIGGDPIWIALLQGRFTTLMATPVGEKSLIRWGMDHAKSTASHSSGRAQG